MGLDWGFPSRRFCSSAMVFLVFIRAYFCSQIKGEKNVWRGVEIVVARSAFGSLLRDRGSVLSVSNYGWLHIPSQRGGVAFVFPRCRTTVSFALNKNGCYPFECSSPSRLLKLSSGFWVLPLLPQSEKEPEKRIVCRSLQKELSRHPHAPLLSISFWRDFSPHVPNLPTYRYLRGFTPRATSICGGSGPTTHIGRPFPKQKVK